MKDGCETEATRTPWNKGKLVGPKLPLQPKHVWAIIPAAIRADFSGIPKAPDL